MPGLKVRGGLAMLLAVLLCNASPAAAQQDAAVPVP
ncbi:hypothetical protein ACVW0I_005246 [Bradyrhizobium sp. LM6.11]